MSKLAAATFICLSLLTFGSRAAGRARPAGDEKKKVISGGVLNGKAIRFPQPAYPPVAKTERASGTVTVEVVVDEDGNVESARAVSGHRLLRDAAVEAAYKAKFKPEVVSGVRVKVRGLLTYSFSYS